MKEDTKRWKIRKEDKKAKGRDRVKPDRGLADPPLTAADRDKTAAAWPRLPCFVSRPYRAPAATLCPTHCLLFVCPVHRCLLVVLTLFLAGFAVRMSHCDRPRQERPNGFEKKRSTYE